MMMLQLNFHSPANESGVSTTYTNSGHITPKVTFKILRVLGEENLWITELAISYSDGRPINAVGIMEFRDGKIAHETRYYADTFEPPEWRSRWVEIIRATEVTKKSMQTTTYFKEK